MRILQLIHSLIASSATANIGVTNVLVLLIYILGKLLDEMAFPD